ncbi:hypothetical protein [Flavitalea sp.]|nr:hypothetical protein [Flavitalea sp.]
MSPLTVTKTGTIKDEAAESLGPVSEYINVVYPSTPTWPENQFFETVHNLFAPSGDEAVDVDETVFGVKEMILDLIKISDADNVKYALRHEGMLLLLRLLEFIEEFEDDKPARLKLEQLIYEKYRGCRSAKELKTARARYERMIKVQQFSDSLSKSKAA